MGIKCPSLRNYNKENKAGGKGPLNKKAEIQERNKERTDVSPKLVLFQLDQGLPHLTCKGPDSSSGLPGLC